MTRAEMHQLNDSQLAQLAIDAAGHIIGERAESVIAERKAQAAPAIAERPARHVVTTLNRLPVIVTAPGLYRTRDGRRVQVHTVKPNADLTVTAFTAGGAIERMFRGKLTFRGFDIWHVSGRAYPLQESPRDIVASETTARLAAIRAAIVAESVSYGEIAELQAIAESNPAALAGDMLLQEWAGIPESEASA